MAFITPKTNWSRSDGVRDTDLNRIEGNIQELYNATLARDGITIYVDARNGNDTTGTGEAGAPYATINKALDVVPRNVNGRDVIISINAGTYNEAVTIKGFDAPITLMSSGNNRVVEINSLRVDGCHCMLNNYIELSTKSTVYVVNGGTLSGDGMLHITGAYLNVNYSSKVSIVTFSCDNSPSFAILADKGSYFYAMEIYGSDNLYGIGSQGGSVVAYGDNHLSADTTQYVTSLGGRIYSGAQTSIPNY